MAIFGKDSSDGVLDFALGSVDESVARQFDDTPGGGVADESGAVIDPTRAASPETEKQVRKMFIVPGFASDALDVVSDERDQLPWQGESDPKRTPEPEDRKLFPDEISVQDDLQRAGETAGEATEEFTGSAFGGLWSGLSTKGKVAVAGTGALIAAGQVGSLFDVGVGN